MVLEVTSPTDHPPGFEFPDWESPLDFDDYVERAPRDQVVRGMFPEALRKLLNDRGHDMQDYPKFRTFHEYPLDDWLHFLAHAARALHPDLTLRQGLRCVGWLAYPTLLDSHIGRVIFGIFGRNLPRIFSAVTKGYRVSGRVGHAKIIESGRNHARYRLEDMFTFADSYQVGVAEGVLRHYGYSGDVKVSVDSISSIELSICWRDPPRQSLDAA